MIPEYNHLHHTENHRKFKTIAAWLLRFKEVTETHLVLISWAQLVPGLWVVLAIPAAEENIGTRHERWINRKRNLTDTYRWSCKPVSPPPNCQFGKWLNKNNGITKKTQDWGSSPDIRVFQGQASQVQDGHGYSSTDEGEKGDQL